MCPRNMTFGRPTPMRAIPFPARSAWAAYPRDRAISTNRRTATASCPEGLYASRRDRSTPTSSIAERPPEALDRAGPLRVRDHEGREEPDHARPAPDRDHAVLLEGLQHGGGLPAQLDADHEPEAPDLAHRGRLEAPEFLEGAGSERLRSLPQLPADDDVDRGAPRRARERVPAERGVVAPLERLLHRLRREGRADRHAAREGLREGQEVGLDAPPLDREEAARAAHPRLHLVEDEEGPRRVADLPRRGEVLGGRDVDAALPLDRLEDHRRGVAVDRLPERVDVVVRDVDEPGDEGLERLPEVPPPRRAERAHRAAVEPAHRGDDLRPARGRAGELQRRLDRLGPRVAQEHPPQVPGCDGEEAPRERGLRVRAKRGADVDQLPRLGGDRLDASGVAVSQVPDAEVCAAVHVLGPSVVPQGRAKSPHERRGPPRGARELDRPRVHRAQAITVPIPSSARSTGSGCWEDAITTRRTPPSSASCAAISFFFILPYAKFMKNVIRSRATSGISVVGSLGSRRRPGTFVNKTRVSAFIATATCAATRSASVLISSPRGVTPGGETTGT